MNLVYLVGGLMFISGFIFGVLYNDIKRSRMGYFLNTRFIGKE